MNTGPERPAAEWTYVPDGIGNLLKETRPAAAEPGKTPRTDALLVEWDHLPTIKALRDHARALESELGEAKQHLRNMLESLPGDCRFDHHGECQEHLGGDEHGCFAAQARKFLGEAKP